MIDDEIDPDCTFTNSNKPTIELSIVLRSLKLRTLKSIAKLFVMVILNCPSEI